MSEQKPTSGQVGDSSLRTTPVLLCRPYGAK